MCLATPVVPLVALLEDNPFAEKCAVLNQYELFV